MKKNHRSYLIFALVASSVLSAIIGGIAGYLAAGAKNGIGLNELLPFENSFQNAGAEENTVVSVVDKASPAVVSIITTRQTRVDNGPLLREFFENFFGFDFFDTAPPREQQLAAGSGFLISSDGMLVTNRHVVDIEGGRTTVLLSDGREFEARVLAKDPIFDLAVLDIDGSNFPVLELGNSDKVKVGQTVIAIGNALGEFANSVSRGVVSGLSRSVIAGAGQSSERLDEVIQTDAAINRGNSGGPLLNLQGEVIGVNTAIVAGAENIGFAIPINQAKRAIEQVRKLGRIVYPFLGVRYVLITPSLAKEQKLASDYGAWLVSDQNVPAVVPQSPADKAGLKEGDIILGIGESKIMPKQDLARLIQSFKVGDTVRLRILRDGAEQELQVTLAERPQ